MATPATSGDVVQVHYTGRLDDGQIFDTSRGQTPLEFKLGERRVIPGFEQAVVGMEPGEATTATIPPDEAYGQRADEMVFQFDREQVPEEVEPQVGQKLELRTKSGRQLTATVTDVTDATVTADANHPLAGRTLTFDIELLAIVN